MIPRAMNLPHSDFYWSFMQTSIAKWKTQVIKARAFMPISMHFTRWDCPFRLLAQRESNTRGASIDLQRLQFHWKPATELTTLSEGRTLVPNVCQYTRDAKEKKKINTIRRLIYYLKLLFITRVEYALNEGAKGNIHRFHAKVIPYKSGYRF